MKVWTPQIQKPSEWIPLPQQPASHKRLKASNNSKLPENCKSVPTAAAEEAKPLDPNDLEFAFEEGQGLEVHPDLIESNPAVPLPAQAESKKRILNMTRPQLALLGGMILIEICVLIGFALVYFLNT